MRRIRERIRKLIGDESVSVERKKLLERIENCDVSGPVLACLFMYANANYRGNTPTWFYVGTEEDRAEQEKDIAESGIATATTKVLDVLGNGRVKWRLEVAFLPDSRIFQDKRDSDCRLL